MNGALWSKYSNEPAGETMRITKKFLFLLPLILAHLGFESRAENEWTGWLGPDRSGFVHGFEPPPEWPEQLQEIWKVNVGTGYGTPLVSGDRVYQHARQNNEEVLWCLSLKTGDTLWRQTKPMPFKMGGGGEFHGKGPKSNPTLAGGRIFTMSITGVLSAFDASSGTPLWSKDFSDRFQKPHPYWGACTSPLADESRVFIRFGGDDDGLLVAFDAQSGRKIWTLGKDGAAYASPLFAVIDGVKQVVEWNHNSLTGVDYETGKRLWDYPFAHVGTNQNMPSPALYKESIIVGGENRGIRRVIPSLENGKWSVEERWYQKRFALDMSSAIVSGDYLYGLSHFRMGQLFCLSAETGEPVWTGPGRSGENATFLAIPGHIITLLNEGEIQILRSGVKSLEKVASYQVSEHPTWAAPVLLRNGFLIKDRETLSYWSLNIR